MAMKLLEREVFQTSIAMASLLLVLFLSSLTVAVEKRSDKPNVMVVGGVFERRDNIQIIAFKKGIEAANDLLSSVTVSAELGRIRLEPHIIQFEEGDSFDANQKCCSMLSKGVVGIIGPTNPLVSYHIRTMCNEFNIPHLEIQWGYRPQNSHFSINIHPYYKSYSKAILSLINTFVSYDTVAVIYHDDEGLLKFEDLFEHDGREQIVVRRWEPDPIKLKYIMKYLKRINVRRFVVDVPPAYIKDFLIGASTFNLTSEIYSYVFTNWDTTMVDLSAFRTNFGANITAFTIVPLVAKGTDYPIRAGTSKYVEELRAELHKSAAIDKILPAPPYVIPTKAALVFDAVITLANAIKGLSYARIVKVTKLHCSKKSLWSHGPSLVNYIKTNTQTAEKLEITGRAYFDGKGQRSNFSLDMYEVIESGYRKYATWHLKGGLKVLKQRSTTMEEGRGELKNKTLRVTTINDAPFVIVIKRDENGVPIPDPRGWDGFCIKLLNLIAADLGFNYTIHIVHDKQYGSFNDTRWNGMIGELIDGTADLALAPLTITYERERVIDFTTPFMNLGLTILFRKPSGKNPHLFSFLQPLSPEVWGYVLAAYVLVSGILFVVARFSPYEWFNPHPCNPDSDVVENQFNIFNSFWFTIASFLQQGSEHAPKSTSTRMVAGIWWFFGLIVISSYTANLAAFLTVERMKNPIESADDLSKQTRIKYGTVFGGSTYSFFKRSEYPTYKTMWEFMQANDQDVFMRTNVKGIERVIKNDDYAFIVESTLNEYYRARNCSLQQIGGRLDSKGYGIGLPEGSRHRDAISESILKLQKNQEIEKLKRFFWQKYKIKTPCDTEQNSGAASSLTVEQVGGVFVVLLMGLLMSIMCSVCEFLYKSRKNASEDRRETTCSEMCKELRFAMQCMASSKRPNMNRPNQSGMADSSSRMRMLMDPPPPPPLRDERSSGRWFESDDRFGVNGTQLDFTPRYSPKYPATGSLSPYPLTPSGDLHFSDNRLKKVPC